jgi:hypothetical protein
MSITVKGGVGIGGGGQIAFLDLGFKSTSAASKPTPASNTNEPGAVIPAENQIDATPWARWGEDNQLPIQMAEDIEECGVLNAGIDGKARFGLGYGPKPFKILGYENKEEILEPVPDTEVLDWLEDNNMFD